MNTSTGEGCPSLDLAFDPETAPLLWVWDFDQTILSIHSYGQRIKAEDVLSGRRNLTEDVADAVFFKQFISEVLKSGSSVAVASFGEYEVIQAYLDILVPGVFNRENISTPTCVGGRDGQGLQDGKVPQLEKLLSGIYRKKVTKEMRARTVLFDDQIDNIRRAHGAGYIAVHTPDAFTRQEWGVMQSCLPSGLVRKA